MMIRTEVNLLSETCSKTEYSARSHLSISDRRVPCIKPFLLPETEHFLYLGFPCYLILSTFYIPLLNLPFDIPFGSETVLLCRFVLSLTTSSSLPHVFVASLTFILP